jgi:hypothetical protein
MQEWVETAKELGRLIPEPKPHLISAWVQSPWVWGGAIEFIFQLGDRFGFQDGRSH